MTILPTRLACAALLSLAATAPCLAESFVSSASSAGSASIASVSDSVEGSSDSSRREDRVAEGDYRVIEVAEVEEPAGRAGLLRITLQAAAQEGPAGVLRLRLPRLALAPRGLAAGDVVSARRRPYGVVFARADSREAFFLVLADDWHREIDPRPVTF